MHRHKVIVLSLLISFAFVLGIWQLAEHKLANIIGNVSYKVFGRSFIEVQTFDRDGIPMRYIPHVGTVYDADHIARSASRGYDTRVEPERMQWFLKGSDWLLAHSDTTGYVAQPYVFPAAGAKAPWFSAPAQSSAMLAIIKRAGQDRDVKALMLARKMLATLKPTADKQLSIAETDSSTWFIAYPEHPYSLHGMLKTLTDLKEYYQLVEDPNAGVLFLQGMRSLASRLPELERNGYLTDKFLYLSLREEHSLLTAMLDNLVSAYPDPMLVNRLKGYIHRQNTFVLLQIFANPSTGRFTGFLLAWLILTFIVYLFLRVPMRNLTRDSG